MKQLLKRLLRTTRTKRLLFFFLGDVLIVALSLHLAFLLRFEFELSDTCRRMMWDVLPAFITVKILALIVFGTYRLTWRYVGIDEALRIVNALFISELLLLVLLWVPMPAFLRSLPVSQPEGFPRSIFVIDGTFSLLLVNFRPESIKFVNFSIFIKSNFCLI